MKRKASPFDLILLIVLCAIGVLLGKQQTLARSQGRTDTVTSVVRSAVTPVSRPLINAGNSMSDFFAGILSSRRLAEENRRLSALAISAQLYNEKVESLQSEITGLRKLQAFGPIPGHSRVPADIIGFFPYENRLTLNVGSQQGVTVGSPVEAPEGLVGTVQVVEKNRCQVLLLTSAGLQIGAVDASRKPPPAGLLKGENSSTLTLTLQDPQATVEVGDLITTYGASERIPGGIFIGRVIAVDKDEEFGSLVAKIDPAVSVGSLREVHVLK